MKAAPYPFTTKGVSLRSTKCACARYLGLYYWKVADYQRGLEIGTRQHWQAKE
jgi:hypothetical protein